jgi:hypothetical protein
VPCYQISDETGERQTIYLILSLCQWRSKISFTTLTSSWRLNSRKRSSPGSPTTTSTTSWTRTAEERKSRVIPWSPRRELRHFLLCLLQPRLPNRPCRRRWLSWEQRRRPSSCLCRRHLPLPRSSLRWWWLSRSSGKSMNLSIRYTTRWWFPIRDQPYKTFNGPNLRMFLNKLECLSLRSLPSFCLLVRPGAYPRVEHLKVASLG